MDSRPLRDPVAGQRLGLDGSAGGHPDLRLHFSPVTRWLDPAEGESTITPYLLLYALHDGLVKPMSGAASAPSLAESWSMAKDGLSAEFVLRAGAKFHNGEPVTAEDVKFSFERYRGGAAKILKDNVKDVQALDARRLRFVFREPWPDFPAFFGTFVASAGWVVPKRYFEQVGEEGFRQAPVGAGPYKFVSFKPGVELVLEAFDGYWRKVPSIKRLVFRSLPDETTRAAALKSGEVDVAFLLSGPTADDVKKTPGLRLVAPLLGIFWLDFPDQWDPKSPWADRRVRLAASLAIDRDALNQAETLGLSRPTGSLVPRDFEFALPFDPHPYDPKRAKQLLVEAGYPNGFDGGELTPFAPYNSMGETILGWLQSVGIRTRMRSMERGAFMTAWREKKLKGVVLTISGVSGNAATRLESFVTSQRRVRLRLVAGGERSLRAPDQGAGPEEARGHGAPDPAHPARASDAGPRLSPGFPNGTRSARRGHPGQRHPRLLHGSVRGPQAQEALSPPLACAGRSHGGMVGPS